MSTSNS
jgi:hypothetical protein